VEIISAITHFVLKWSINPKPNPRPVYSHSKSRQYYDALKTPIFYVDGLSSNIVVQYSVGPTITLCDRITAREYVDRLGNQVHPMVQMLFPNNDAVFQDDWRRVKKDSAACSWLVSVIFN
jgi:hypothetical protein